MGGGDVGGSGRGAPEAVWRQSGGSWPMQCGGVLFSQKSRSHAVWRVGGGSQGAALPCSVALILS